MDKRNKIPSHEMSEQIENPNVLLRCEEVLRQPRRTSTEQQKQAVEQDVTAPCLDVATPPALNAAVSVLVEQMDISDLPHQRLEPETRKRSSKDALEDLNIADDIVHTPVSLKIVLCHPSHTARVHSNIGHTIITLVERDEQVLRQPRRTSTEQREQAIEQDVTASCLDVSTPPALNAADVVLDKQMDISDLPHQRPEPETCKWSTDNALEDLNSADDIVSTSVSPDISHARVHSNISHATSSGYLRNSGIVTRTPLAERVEQVLRLPRRTSTEQQEQAVEQDVTAPCLDVSTPSALNAADVVLDEQVDISDLPHPRPEPETSKWSSDYALEDLNSADDIVSTPVSPDISNATRVHSSISHATSSGYLRNCGIVTRTPLAERVEQMLRQPRRISTEQQEPAVKQDVTVPCLDVPTPPALNAAAGVLDEPVDISDLPHQRPEPETREWSSDDALENLNSADDIVPTPVSPVIVLRHHSHTTRVHSNISHTINSSTFRNSGIATTPLITRDVQVLRQPRRRSTEQQDQSVEQDVTAPSLDVATPPALNASAGVHIEQMTFSNLVLQRLEMQIRNRGSENVLENPASKKPRRSGYKSFKEHQTLSRVKSDACLEADKESIPKPPARQQTLKERTTLMLDSSQIENQIPGTSLMDNNPIRSESTVIITDSSPVICPKESKGDTKTPPGSLDRTLVSLGDTQHSSPTHKFIEENWGTEGTMLKILRMVKRRNRPITVATLLEQGPVLGGHKRRCAARCLVAILKLKQHELITVHKDLNTNEIMDIDLGKRFL